MESTNNNPSNQEILTKVNELGTTVKDMGVTVNELGTTVKDMGVTVNELGTTVKDMGVTVNELGTTVKDMGVTVNELGTTVKELTTTVDDLASAVNKFANKVEERFDGIESDIKDMKATMTTLATKDFVVEQNDKLKGDIIETMRKGDKKLLTTVDILHEKKVMDDADIKRVVSMEPFPQLSV